MGMIDDIRKLLQDLVTPDLKAIEARLVAGDASSKLRDDGLAAFIASIDAASKLRDDSLLSAIASMERLSKMRDDGLAVSLASTERASTMRDERLMTSIDSIEAASKMRDEALQASIAAKVDLILARMDAQHSTVMNSLAIDKRLENLERQAKPAEQAAV